MSVFCEKELDIAKRDGVAAHEAGLRRSHCPFSFPDLGGAWESGWIEHQKECRREYQRQYRLRKKLEKTND